MLFRSTDQCGMNAVAEFGGEVVPATIAGLTCGLEKMLSAPETLKLKGMQLCDYVIARYLWSTVVKDYVALYDHVLTGWGA